MSESWEMCENESFESEVSRGPLNMGPARRIAESPFLIVTGTKYSYHKIFFPMCDLGHKDTRYGTSEWLPMRLSF